MAVEVVDDVEGLADGPIVGENCEISSRVVVDAGRTIGAYCHIEASNRIIKDIPDSSRVI